MLVGINGELEHQFAARIEGQTAELDVAITVAELGPGLDPDNLAAAVLDEAEARGAEAAVWFVAEGDGWVVSVSRSGRTVRRLVVVESKGTLASSSSIEAVALVVRSSLRGVLGGEWSAQAPPSEPAPSAPGYFAELGWTAALDRASSYGHHGVEARVGIDVDGWRISLLLEEHPPETVAAREVTVELERQVLALVFGYRFRLAPRWRFGAALGAELLRFPRVTTVVADGLVATSPQSSASGAVRPELDVALRLFWSLWLCLRVGADFLFSWPQFTVRQEGAARVVATLWQVQPTATLGLGVEFP